jgi:hypothetical protein
MLLLRAGGRLSEQALRRPDHALLNDDIGAAWCVKDDSVNSSHAATWRPPAACVDTGGSASG